MTELEQLVEGRNATYSQLASENNTLLNNVTSDNDIACPDPECGARFRIVRGAAREYLRSENTATPFPADATA